MKVLQINSVCGYGSTGKIVTDIYNVLEKQGHECLIAYGRGRAPSGICSYKIGNDLNVYYHALMSRITDRQGLYSSKATLALIDKIKNYKPDIIQLHNLHGYYLNYAVLFKFLTEFGAPVVWTLHDCWAFTGHCAYFDFVGCNKWKTECFNCEQKKSYPSTIFFDNSSGNYLLKERIFSNIDNMIIVTPSLWLANLVKKSILKKHEVTVINNGIDLDVFHFTNDYFKKNNGLESKILILGVASIWDQRKGLGDFIKLSKILNDNYQIVIIGVSKKQKSTLPQNIISFMKTENATELADFYSAADVFFNPTYEDNFPTTNLEALACGTPVITYDSGGSPECINDSCGCVVKKGDIIAAVNAIEILTSKNRKDMNNCIYDKTDCFYSYINLYNRILKR